MKPEQDKPEGMPAVAEEALADEARETEEPRAPEAIYVWKYEGGAWLPDD
jgi:hypothetical protein